MVKLVIQGLKQLGLKVEGNPATVVTLAIAPLSLLVRGAGPLPIDLAASHLIQSIRVGWYDVLLRAVGEPGYPPPVYVLTAPGVAAYLTARQTEIQDLNRTFAPVWAQVQCEEFRRQLGALVMAL